MVRGQPDRFQMGELGIGRLLQKLEHLRQQQERWRREQDRIGRVERGAESTAIRLPRIIAVRSSDTFKGDDWIGLKMRDASVVRGVGVLPIFAGLIGLLLLLGAFAATWVREGR